MEAQKKFFEKYHGISSLLKKGMPSDILFEGKTFNIEDIREKYIPYSCRCEAIGGGRDKGLLYRGLDGAWDTVIIDNSMASKRDFKIPESWAGYRLYLVIDEISPKTTVYINGALACFSFDENREYLESEITAHINFDIGNEIVIISEEMITEKMCRASIVARKFVHIRDYKCLINESDVSVNVSMSRNIPAKVLAEIYDEVLELIATCESEINGEGILSCNVSMPVRLILLVCGSEVIPIPMAMHVRADLPVGETADEYETGSAREFDITAVDIDSGIFDISALGDCNNASVQYKIFAENGTLHDGELPLNFEVKSICRVMIDYNIPSLSFYEYFIDFKVNGEFIGQFKLPVKQTACERILSSDMPGFLSIDIADGKVVARGVNFENIFNTEKGKIERISKEGCDIVKECGLPIFCGIRATHQRSTVVSRDNHHVGISSVYSAKNNEVEISISALTILYSNGEIGVSVSGFIIGECNVEENNLTVTYQLPDTLTLSKVYGAKAVNNTQRFGVYDCTSYSGQSFDDCRWAYYYGTRVPGLFVKGMPALDLRFSGSTLSRNISPGITVSISPDENNMLATTFVLKAVFCENEDIIREARIIPFVG